MNSLRGRWSLDPEVTFLNHGSFGAAPTAVLEHQHELRKQLEREPVRFFLREAPELWQEAILRGAAFIGADPRGFAYVHNATTGVNTVLRSLDFEPGDELLVTDHEYGACRITLDEVAAKTGATVRVVNLPFPGTTPEAVVSAITNKITKRTRLLLIDHVTSPTALVLPIKEVASACQAAGVEVLVDGAHAIGMLDLDIDSLGVDYYTGNFHKWGCTPKGVAALWVAPRHLCRIRPLVTSHGARTAAADAAARFRNEFDWIGTNDPTAPMSVPFTIDYLAGLVDGGWAAIRKHNNELALAGRQILLDALGATPPADVRMLGSMATIPLSPSDHLPTSIYDLDPLQQRLMDEFGIEVPVLLWPGRPHRWLRISAQLYNDLDDIRALSSALAKIL